VTVSVRKTVGTVGTLAQGAVSTAVSVARHPIGSASLAVGLVKGVAEAGIDLVRSTAAEPEAPQSEAPQSEAPQPETPQPETPQPQTPETPVAQAPAAAPERDLPGPDLVAFEPPDPADLPEPIVIEALDEPGEAFHTEPKAASRDSDHGGQPGDREEAEGYLEEIPDVADETPVWTSETLVDQPVE
jgi:hypothetical protein